MGNILCLPKNGFGPPPPPIYDTVSPPPMCSRHVIFSGGNGHRPDKSHFVRPPKVALEGHSIVRFPPPQNRTTRFASPESDIQAKFVADRGVAKFWQTSLQIFVLEFPGKVAARNFAKNLRHCPRGTKQNSSRRDSGGGGGGRILKTLTSLTFASSDVFLDDMITGAQLAPVFNFGEFRPPQRYHTPLDLGYLGARDSNHDPLESQGPPNGGVSNGGVSRSVLVLPFLSFFVLSRFSRIFPICSGTVRGFSRFVPFLFLGLLRAPTRNSPERVRDTIWAFPVGNPPVWKPPRLASLKNHDPLATRIASESQNNPRAHKRKSALPPKKKNPKYTPLKQGVLWAWRFSCRKNFPALELRAKHFTDTRLFLRIESRDLKPILKM